MILFVAFHRNTNPSLIRHSRWLLFPEAKSAHSWNVPFNGKLMLGERKQMRLNPSWICKHFHLAAIAARLFAMLARFSSSAPSNVQKSVDCMMKGKHRIPAKVARLYRACVLDLRYQHFSSFHLSFAQFFRLIFSSHSLSLSLSRVRCYSFEAITHTKL